MSLFQLEEEGFGGQCVRDPDSTLDPFAVPSTCPAGEFYNRTKGYRLVAGDTCQVVFTTAVLFSFFPHSQFLAFFTVSRLLQCLHSSSSLV